MPPISQSTAQQTVPLQMLQLQPCAPTGSCQTQSAMSASQSPTWPQSPSSPPAATYACACTCTASEWVTYIVVRNTPRSHTLTELIWAWLAGFTCTRSASSADTISRNVSPMDLLRSRFAGPRRRYNSAPQHAMQTTTPTHEEIITPSCSGVSPSWWSAAGALQPCFVCPHGSTHTCPVAATTVPLRAREASRQCPEQFMLDSISAAPKVPGGQRCRTPRLTEPHKATGVRVQIVGET